MPYALTYTEHPSDSQRYFGFPSWRETKKYIQCSWPGMELRISSSQNSIRTSFEQCLMAKMFMKTAFEHEDLSRIWDASRSYVSSILKKWCPRWGAMARIHVRLQSLPLHFIEASQPDGFEERYHTIPATEVDGKDIRCEQIRKDNIGKRLTRSNKYKSAALRLCVLCCVCDSIRVRFCLKLIISFSLSSFDYLYLITTCIIDG